MTAAGRELYRYALPILAMVDELEQTLYGGRPQLRLGSSISIGACMLPALVRDFEQAHPEVEVLVRINSAELIEQAVLSGAVEFALIEGGVHSDRLAMEPYLDDELVVLCAADDPLAARGTITAADLRERKLLLRERNSATREIAETTLATHGVAVSPAWESTDTMALLAGVIAGVGLSILPRRVVQPLADSGRVALLQVAGLEFKRTYNIVYLQNKYLSEPALAFLRLADTQAKTRFN
jgi:DNA-binding transcriptional LysR family regulator